MYRAGAHYSGRRLRLAAVALNAAAYEGEMCKWLLRHVGVVARHVIDSRAQNLVLDVRVDAIDNQLRRHGMASGVGRNRGVAGNGCRADDTFD